MDERIVEGGIDVRDAEDDLALRNLGTELDQLFLRDFGLLWWLSSKDMTTNPLQNRDHKHSIR